MQTVAVTTQVTGTLLDVIFKEGDVVETGQVLFHIDPRPLQAARRSGARDARARRSAGRSGQARTTSGTEARRHGIREPLAGRPDARDRARAGGNGATRTRPRFAPRVVNLGFATIRAPIAGRTGSLLVRQGNNVSPGGSPLVVINQISPVLVRFPVLAQDFATLQRAVAAHPIHVRAAASDSGSMTNELGSSGFSTTPSIR